MSRPEISNSTISVVMPLLNEVAVVRSLVEKVTLTMESVGCQWNVVLVNDGSTDGSRELLDAMADDDHRIKVLHLSRNFGHQAAVHAGLCHASGDAVALMDSDAQDDPQALAEMIRLWQSGEDVVYAVRFARKESLPKRIAFSAFHRLLGSIASVSIPRDAGNFGLLDARVVQEIIALGETDRYFPGLRTWVGFRQCALPVERLRRHDDQPRVSIRGLISLAKTAMFSFSRVPLLAFYGLAMFSALIGVACFSWAVYHKIFTGAAVPGWASITSLSAFFGAINALGIAILGEYVTRIYDQVRNRPAFVIQQTRNVPAMLLDRFERRHVHETNRVSMAHGATDQLVDDRSGNSSELKLLAEIQMLRDELQSLKSTRSIKPAFPGVSLDETLTGIPAAGLSSAPLSR